jgi:hypothetical protein
MAPKKILTVGLQLASEQVQYASFQSKMSLLDWDIILYRPDLDAMSYSTEDYQGKPCLNDSDSFRLKECCEHWRREIKEAFETGKTVFVFLAPLRELYVATGQRSYSGTGRNRATTRHVTEYSNYQSLPVTLGQVSSTGISMKLAARRGAEILTSYWHEFEDDSRYQVLLTHNKVPACVVTKTGDKAVGAIYRSDALGTLLLLPDLNFCPNQFLQYKDENEDEEEDVDEEEDSDVYNDNGVAWTPIARQFASRMIGAVVAIDRALRSEAEATPEPSWTAERQFALAAESELRTKLLEAETQVEQAQRHKEEIAEELKTAGSFRALLFEKGKPLEKAIIEALRLLGFSAMPYKDSESEFDVVFASEEGRLIGEAEGKDNKPVNIDKLRQLAMNIHEDLRREEVNSPAKGVLFGNGFRLQSPHGRSDPFTDKCHSAAPSMGIALVFTADLFPIVKYLLARSDAQYSLACRRAILTGVGRVSFPDLPPEPEATCIAETRDSLVPSPSN